MVLAWDELTIMVASKEDGMSFVIRPVEAELMESPATM